jgi:hypothetical protein
MNNELRPLSDAQKQFVRDMIRQAIDARQREQIHKGVNWDTMANYNEGIKIGVLFTIRSYVNRLRSPLSKL